MRIVEIKPVHVAAVHHGGVRDGQPVPVAPYGGLGIASPIARRFRHRIRVGLPCCSQAYTQSVQKMELRLLDHLPGNVLVR